MKSANPNPTLPWGNVGSVPAGLETPGRAPFQSSDNPTPDDYPQHGPQLSDLEKPKPATPVALIPAVEAYAAQGETAHVSPPEMHQTTDTAPKHAPERGINPKTVIPPKSFQQASKRWESGRPYAAFGEQFPTSPSSR